MKKEVVEDDEVYAEIELLSVYDDFDDLVEDDEISSEEAWFLLGYTEAD